MDEFMQTTRDSAGALGAAISALAFVAAKHSRSERDFIEDLIALCSTMETDQQMHATRALFGQLRESMQHRLERLVE